MHSPPGPGDGVGHFWAYVAHPAGPGLGWWNANDALVGHLPGGYDDVARLVRGARHEVMRIALFVFE
jgi:hypothetical protein